MPRVAFFLLSLFLPLAIVGLATLRGQEPALTRIVDVRSLSVSDAQQGKPALINGVVVYVERVAVFVQDEHGSTFFRPNERQLSLKVGDEVEVRGPTQMGRYIAGLGASEVKVLRHDAPVPTIPAGYDDVVSARYFYQRVAVEGIVRSIAQNKDWIALRLAMGSRILEVRFAQPPPSNRKLIDARVRIKGLSAGSINDQRQLIETFLRIQSWDEIEILEPPTPDDQVPSVAPGELLSFRPDGRPDRRIAVAGSVTAVFRDGETYLAAGDVGFAARLNRPVDLSVGDRIELVGFAEVFQFAASVVDAEIRRREPGPAPQPVAVRSPDLLNLSHDTRLVAVEARIADAFKSPEGHTLVLSGQTRTIQAFVPASDLEPVTGSLIRVTGICHVDLAPSLDFVRRAGAIHLQTRSAEDVMLLAALRWWTTRKLFVALGVLGGVILIAGIWNLLLHRQVRRKTAALRERIESEAALEERQRIAQEFHDTLEQDLTGLALRLDTATALAFDANGRQILGASRNLLSRIQTETKSIVSNLRDPALLEMDLTSTLEALVKNCAEVDGLDVQLRIASPLPQLPGSTLRHVHLIARESLNNALKHARATVVAIEVSADPSRLLLRVSDNGSGFDAERESRGKSGHFGCIGIRERARKIGATVAWQSTPGNGTTVTLTLPLIVAAPAPARPRSADA